MNTVTVPLSTWIAQVKASLPAAFGPVIDNALAVLEAWGQEQLNDWIALAQSEPDAARAQLLATMNEAGLTNQTQIDAAALAAAVSANADSTAKWQAVFNQLIAAVVGSLIIVV